MHLADALSVLENYDSERLLNVIMYVFGMTLKGLPVFLPRDLSQLETQLLLKLGTPIRYADGVS